MTTVIDGNAVAAEVRSGLGPAIEALADEDIVPGLATVLMSEDPASETYVSMKRRACEDIGIESVYVEIDPGDPAEVLYDAIEELNQDPDVHGTLVQFPLPDHVDKYRVIRSIDPLKDVEGLHPENMGRLFADEPRFKPCTPHGIQELLEHAGVDPTGKDAVIVGASDIVGKPMATMLMQENGDFGNATVTVCHSETRDLGRKTREGDILIAACGVPELIDAPMVKEGATVIDVGVNRVEDDAGDDHELVGDVDFESVREKAAHITPVPGGVGPMTIAMLLYNTVKAAGLRAGIAVPLP